MLLNALLGQQNPLAQWASGNNNFLTALGAGIASGPDLASGIGAGLRAAPQAKMLDMQVAEQRADKARQEQQQNATKAFLQEKAPDLAQLLDTGIPMGEVWGEYMRRQQPTTTEMKNPYMSAGDGQFFNWQTGEFVSNPNAKPDRPNPPSGFQWSADGSSLERIPGGPEDPAVNNPAAAVNIERLNSQTDNVIATIDKAIGQVAWDSTGLIGQGLGLIGGTKALDLRETAKTIKANLGFAELQAMREASPTGGALGQVAVQELESLQATLASLNPDQSEGQLRENLERVKVLLERQKQFREQANQAKFAPPGNVSGQGWTVIGVE